MDVDPSLSTVNVTNGPVFVYLPRSKCRVGVCYSDFINPVNLHIMCRQLGYATFSGSSSVPNTQLISTVQPSDLPCFGPERTVQECLQGMNILVRNDCQNLLSFTCIQSK